MIEINNERSDGAHLDRLREQGYLTDPSHLVTVAVPGLDRPTKGASPASRDKGTPPGGFGGAAARMLAADPDARVAFLSTAPCTLAVAKSGARLPVLLDDLAQLTGPSVPLARDFSRVRGRTAKASAAFVSGEGCLCRGTDAYEAHALAMVVEKACMAFIGSSYLGGGKTIPFREALLMRLIYRLKYGRIRR